MKFSKNHLQQIIEEEFNEMVNEDADPGKFDPSRFPLELSKINPAKAKIATTHGHSKFDKHPNDDVISVNTSFTAPVGDLKPSQTSMNIGKAMGMALAMIMGKEGGGMPLGGNLGAFISQDDYIMDGHHRWIATAMVDPSKEVGGFRVGFPGAELVAILNAMTAGQFGITKGKKGSGGFDQFEAEPIRDALLTFVKEGTPGEFGKDTAWVANAIEKFTGKTVEEGGVDAAVKKFLINLDAVKPLTAKILPVAPDRSDMPVIDKPDISQAVNALEKGHIDVNPPYYQGEKEVVAESKNLMSISKDRLKEIIKEELANRKRRQ